MIDFTGFVFTTKIQFLIGQQMWSTVKIKEQYLRLVRESSLVVLILNDLSPTLSVTLYFVWSSKMRCVVLRIEYFCTPDES